MCLGTFSRLRRSLAISALYAAVRILAERFLLYRKAISCKVKKRCQKHVSVFLTSSSTARTIALFYSYCKGIFKSINYLKSQAINAKLYLRNIISSFCITMFAFCWQICTDCPSFRFALCLFYSFYASLASSFWNSSPEVFHPNISLG